VPPRIGPEWVLDLDGLEEASRLERVQPKSFRCLLGLLYSSDSTLLARHLELIQPKIGSNPTVCMKLEGFWPGLCLYHQREITYIW
jgi:hypothetical protein